jgi:hypothetical protein
MTYYIRAAQKKKMDILTVKFYNGIGETIKEGTPIAVMPSE